MQRSSLFGGKHEGWKVSRDDRLTGPDFTSGDAAWKERLSELIARYPNSFSRQRTENNYDKQTLATAAPLTVLYVLAHNHKRLFPHTVPNPLRVHVLGAAYPFEGRGDWELLASAMPPGVSLEVSLVLGTPDQADGVPDVRIQEIKKQLCRTRGIVTVKCIESYYQHVMHDIAKPHLAMMFNPGFPQVHRRTWDPTLLYLLQEKIPSAVSAQTVLSKGWPQAGEPWFSDFTEYANEDYPINATLVAYGADTWGATGSPFPIVEKNGVIKNSVIELFQGLLHGAILPTPPASIPQEQIEFLNTVDWEKAEQMTNDDSLHDEMKDALMTPVSVDFVHAADEVYSQYLRKVTESPDFQEKSEKVRRRVLALLDAMQRKKALTPQDWLFLKVNFYLD